MNISLIKIEFCLNKNFYYLNKMNKLPVELHEKILDLSCESGYHYLNFCLTSKYFYNVSENIKEKIKKRVKNDLWLLIKKYPDKEWDWYSISQNSGITMENIERYSDKNWNCSSISQNPNLTMEFIEKYSNKNWDWYGISYIPNLTMEFVDKYSNKNWNWIGISHNFLISTRRR